MFMCINSSSRYEGFDNWIQVATQHHAADVRARSLFNPQKFGMRGMADVDHIGGNVAGLTIMVTGPTRLVVTGLRLLGLESCMQ